MKLFFLVYLLVSLFSVSCVFAGSITISWSPNTETDLAGYKVYYGLSTRNYPLSKDVGNVTTYTLEDLTPDIYYIAVTAYDYQELESDYSNEVFGTIENRPPNNPSRCIINEIKHD